MPVADNSFAIKGLRYKRPSADAFYPVRDYRSVESGYQTNSHAVGMCP